MQTDPSPSGPRFLGKYEVLARLDSGGMAEIFLARARGLAGFEKLVVLKRILPHLAAEEEFVSMFLDEAKTTVALSHGNIVQVFDMGKGEEGDYFIAMEYVAGKNLRRFLKRSLEKEQGPIDAPLAAWIAAEILRGLDYAHRRTDSAGKPLGIVHRDLSPHNILISYEGEVKVADFGIAKAAGKVVHTETGLIRGKAAYMSPEQARADELDGRSDLFSTGILLYELLTGVPPYDGDTSDQILRKLLAGPPPAPSSVCPAVPRALDRVVLKALETDRDLRYSTADVFLKELGTFMATNGIVIGPRDLSAKMSALFSEDIAEERRTMGSLPKAVAAPEARVQVGVTPQVPPTGATVPHTGLMAFVGRAPAWAKVASGVAVAAFVGSAGWLALGGHPVAPPTPAPSPSPSISVTATPPPPTATPTAVAEVSVRPSPTVKPKATPRSFPIATVTATPAATPTPTVVAAVTGKLGISAHPWAYVWMDGEPLCCDNAMKVNGREVSTTPIRDLKVKAGHHRIHVEKWIDGRSVASGDAEVDVPPDGKVTVTFQEDGDNTGPNFVRSGS